MKNYCEVKCELRLSRKHTFFFLRFIDFILEKERESMSERKGKRRGREADSG